jgi:hypothetical protein
MLLDSIDRTPYFQEMVLTIDRVLARVTNCTFAIFLNILNIFTLNEYTSLSIDFTNRFYLRYDMDKPCQANCPPYPIQ